jgi:hypothetical protein
MGSQLQLGGRTPDLHRLDLVLEVLDQHLREAWK